MKQTSTRLVSEPMCMLQDGKDTRVVIEFDAAGYYVIEDTRVNKSSGASGYLHYVEGVSAPEITDDVRDTIVWYMYHCNPDPFGPSGLPSLGATPQKKYMSGLSIQDRERIGNRGKREFYA